MTATAAPAPIVAIRTTNRMAADSPGPANLGPDLRILLKAVYDVLLVGDDAPIPMSERPEWKRTVTQRTLAATLRAYAGMSRLIVSRVGPLVGMVLAEGAGADLANFLAAIDRERRIGNTAVVRHRRPVRAAQRAERGPGDRPCVDAHRSGGSRPAGPPMRMELGRLRAVVGDAADGRVVLEEPVFTPGIPPVAAMLPDLDGADDHGQGHERHPKKPCRMPVTRPTPIDRVSTPSGSNVLSCRCAEARLSIGSAHSTAEGRPTKPVSALRQR